MILERKVMESMPETRKTLKTLVKEPGRIGLQAANPKYETRYFKNNEIEVQGKLAGLIRNY